MATRKKKGRLPKETKNESVIDINEARRERQALRDAEQKKKGKKSTAAKKKVVSNERHPKKFSKRSLAYLGILAIIVILLIVSVSRLVSLKQQEAQAQATLDEMNNEKGELQTLLESASSDEYIEQQARDLLKMIKPGEIFYVLPEGEHAATTGSAVGADPAAKDTGAGE